MIMIEEASKSIEELEEECEHNKIAYFIVGLVMGAIIFGIFGFMIGFDYATRW